jgi:hypothetical protein
MEDAVAIHQGTYRGAVLPAAEPSTDHGIPSVYRSEGVTIVARHHWGPLGVPSCDGYRVREEDDVRRYTWDAERPCSALEVAALLNVTVR